ncbi:hypothetical protein JMN32_25250 [Fulvivirga sp. 29W222]|uniref:Uncharacterized protein n=1 Tax=Fulvivirga marina TaxID=2494733 RepID=A0A937KED9_9BACT|nr:hypothetical protein [Fulvivirga marina]MBL6449642.1 hypothetical protein [Fulvivirga marina]
MTNQLVNYPRLETILHTEYDGILEYLHLQLKRCSVCWLAYERLEKMLASNNGMIAFIKQGYEHSIATILFNPQYVATEKAKPAGESPENMSVRHSRKPIRYSLKCFKRKLSGVKLR